MNMIRQVGGSPYNRHQQGMIDLGLSLSAKDPPRVRRALLAAMAVESNFRNLNYGDRDSQGVLQQRPSTGWGAPGNASQDISQFLARARAANRGFQGTAGQLAQSIQRSAFPGRYDEQMGRINDILRSRGVAAAAAAVGSLPGVGTPAVEATAPKLDRALMSRNIRDSFLQGRGRIDLGGLPSLLRRSYDQGTPGTPASFTPGQADTLPSTDARAAPLRADPNGKWGGSKSVASQLAQLGISQGLSATSEKRDRQSTKSGGVSDHWTGSLNSYAYDLSNGSSPTKEMDAAARQILRRLGVQWDGHSPVVVSKNVGGYRVQVLYRTQVGGDHSNHVHVGVRKL